MVETIIQNLQNLNPLFIHLFLIASTFTENIFPVWPGDTFIVFAGFLIYHNVIDVFSTYLSTTIGNFIGAFTMYFFGKNILDFAHKTHSKIHTRFLRKALEDLISEKNLQTTQLWFQKWGFLFVAASRFFAGIRFFVSIFAGMMKLNLFYFSIAFFVGLLIWNSLLFAGGYILAENWRKVVEWIELYSYFITIFLISIIVFFIYIKMKLKQKSF
ncbi:MAG: DedA family protein [Leptospiraceae bacterium]|nr:DedA family protein [Leptospiraceae bacterium]MDW7976136.1 DedA family protein [Leptospiraceae bacterium]